MMVQKIIVLILIRTIIVESAYVGITVPNIEVGADSGSRLELKREKRAATTICVEIKPKDLYEEPYFMCKGAEISSPLDVAKVDGAKSTQEFFKTSNQPEQNGRSYPEELPIPFFGTFNGHTPVPISNPSVFSTSNFNLLNNGQTIPHETRNPTVMEVPQKKFYILNENNDQHQVFNEERAHEMIKNYILLKNNNPSNLNHQKQLSTDEQRTREWLKNYDIPHVKKHQTPSFDENKLREWLKHKMPLNNDPAVPIARSKIASFNNPDETINTMTNAAGNSDSNLHHYTKNHQIDPKWIITNENRNLLKNNEIDVDEVARKLFHKTIEVPKPRPAIFIPADQSYSQPANPTPYSLAISTPAPLSLPTLNYVAPGYPSPIVTLPTATLYICQTCNGDYVYCIQPAVIAVPACFGNNCDNPSTNNEEIKKIHKNGKERKNKPKKGDGKKLETTESTMISTLNQTEDEYFKINQLKNEEDKNEKQNSTSTEWSHNDITTMKYDNKEIKIPIQEDELKTNDIKVKNSNTETKFAYDTMMRMAKLAAQLHKNDDDDDDDDDTEEDDVDVDNVGYDDDRTRLRSNKIDQRSEKRHTQSLSIPSFFKQPMFRKQILYTI